MLVATQRYPEVLGQGERFTVTFSQAQLGGHPCGVYQGYKVVPWHHSYDVRRGQTWEVEEILRFGGGSTVKALNKVRHDHTQAAAIQWGAVVYVRPIRRL